MRADIAFWAIANGNRSAASSTTFLSPPFVDLANRI